MNACRVRSLAERGHWRSGKFWGPGFVDIAVEEITDLMWADPRIEVEVNGVTVQAAINGLGVGAAQVAAVKKRRKKKGR